MRKCGQKVYPFFNGNFGLFVGEFCFNLNFIKNKIFYLHCIDKNGCKKYNKLVQNMNEYSIKYDDGWAKTFGKA
jgi:hypothetical protein